MCIYCDYCVYHYKSIELVSSLVSLFSCEYAKEYDIMFNPKKTVCIKFGSKIHNDEHVSMNGFTVQ